MIHVKFFVPLLADIAQSPVGRALNVVLPEHGVNLVGVERDDRFPCVLAVICDDEQAERRSP